MVTSRRERQPGSTAIDSPADRRAALSLLIQIGAFGTQLTHRIRAHVDDQDAVANLPAAMLCYIAVEGPCRPVAIQRVTGLSSGGVTKLIDGMEEKGLVARTHGAIASDRRAIVVSLTAAGERTVEQLATSVIAEADLARDGLRRLLDGAEALIAARG